MDLGLRGGTVRTLAMPAATMAGRRIATAPGAVYAGAGATGGPAS